jgi:hypothetical protein
MPCICDAVVAPTNGRLLTEEVECCVVGRSFQVPDPRRALIGCRSSSLSIAERANERLDKHEHATYASVYQHLDAFLASTCCAKNRSISSLGATAVSLRSPQNTPDCNDERIKAANTTAKGASKSITVALQASECTYRMDRVLSTRGVPSNSPWRHIRRWSIHHHLQAWIRSILHCLAGRRQQV